MFLMRLRQGLEGLRDLIGPARAQRSSLVRFVPLGYTPTVAVLACSWSTVLFSAVSRVHRPPVVLACRQLKARIAETSSALPPCRKVLARRKRPQRSYEHAR